MTEDERHDWDEVVLYAMKDGNTETMQLSRRVAEGRREELRAQGWIVDVIDVVRED